VGGIEQFVDTLASGLVRRGHEVRVLCARYRGAPLREDHAGFEIRRIPSSYVLERRFDVPYPLPSPRHLFAAMSEEVERADVVHVQDALYATSVAGLALAHRHDVPSILTQHVAFVPQRSRWLDAVERAAVTGVGRTARLATRVASYNPAVAGWAERTWGIAEVRVLPVGVEAAPAYEGDWQRSAVRESFGLPAERFLALFVGRDVPKKGLDVFLAGSDDAYDLVAVTDRSGDDAPARIFPFMSHERLRKLLSCVDAFVLPSEAEGFPLSLQEALAAGLPIVTTNQPGYEHYLSGEDALLVEREPRAVRAALQRLAADDALRLRLAEGSRAVAERHFSVERFVTGYEQLYREACLDP